MNDRLKRIEEELAAEVEQIDASLAEVDDRRTELLADRERVLGSLTALKPSKPTSARKRGQPRRPCATKAEVATVVQSLIEQNGPCPEGDLIGLAEDRLREEGKSLSGFQLRYRIIREELLTETGTGRLALRPNRPKAETER